MRPANHAARLSNACFDANGLG